MAEKGKRAVDPASLPTLQSQMFKYFGGFITLAVVLIFTVLAVGIALTGERTNTISREGLDDQIDTHLRTSARELSARVGLELGAVENGVVRYMTSIHSQATSPDFIWTPPAVDHTFSTVPTASKERVARVNNELRSLEFSTYYLAPGVTATPEVQRTLSQSRSMQYMYLDLWFANPSVVAMYSGYQTGAMRLYPGQDPDEVVTDYDPRGRGWYTAAVAAETNLIRTSPYVDAFGLGWLITLAQPIANASSTSQQLTGVAGADVTIKTLQESILAVGFFSQTSSAAMIQFDGQVVADPFWDSDADATSAYAASAAAGSPAAGLDALNSFSAPLVYNVHPGITEELWESIRDPTGGIKTVEYSRAGEVFILARSFVPLHPLDDPSLTPAQAAQATATYVPQYVVIVEARRADVHATLEDMAARIEAGTGTLIGIAAGVCLLTLLVVLGVLYWTSHTVTAPLQGMMDVARAITSSADIGVAGGDIRDKTAAIPESGDEIGVFAGHFKRMVNGLDSKEVTRTRAAAPVPNKLFRRLAGCEFQAEPPPRAAHLPWEEGFRNLGIPLDDE